MQRPSTTLVLFVTVLLVTAGVPAVLGATTSSGSDSTTCDLHRSGSLVAGDAGFGAAEGATYAWEGIPSACQGVEFALTGSNPGDDFDISFYDADGNDIGAHTNGAGDESGTIPSNAVEAKVTYWAGAGGTYTLDAPPTTAEEPTLGSDPVTNGTTLYLHSGPTGVGNADVLFGGSTMDPEAPTSSTPSTWTGTWGLDGTSPNSVWDANWRWNPEDGYNFTNEEVSVSFWAVTASDSAIIGMVFDVALWSDGQKVAEKLELSAMPSAPGMPTQLTHTFQGLSFSGQTLTLTIDPHYLFNDGANAILFDSVDYPSHVAVGVEAPAVENLTTDGVGSSHVALTWDEVDLGGNLDHYRVLRDGTVVGEPDDASFLDTGLDADTTYTYTVQAVAYDGNATPESTPLDVATETSDTTAPTIQDVAVDAGATSLKVTWSTSELAVGTVDVAGRSLTTGPATEHEVRVTDLEPGSSLQLDITAEDLAGNVNTTTETATTSATQVLFLHNQLQEEGKFLNEFDEDGDAEQTYNDLGGVLATAGVLGPVDRFPASHPAAPTVDLRQGMVEATIYVRDLHESPVDHPNGSEFRADEGANHIELRLTLLANGGQVLAEGTVERTLVDEDDWVPFHFTLAPQFASVESGSLEAVLQAETATSGYAYGYEGDHASQIRLPIEPDLPLQASATPPDKVMADAPQTFEASALGGSTPYTFTWAWPDGTQDTGATVNHTFADRGPATVDLTVEDADGDTVTRTLDLRVHQRDFVNESRTVVAVVDSGVNPYHPVYQRPGIDLPLSGFVNTYTGNAPATVDLSDSGSFEERVKSYRKDRSTWSGIGKGELVHFAGTNVLGVSFGSTELGRVIDVNGHGTATTSTVLDNFPDATIVMVQATSGGDELANAVTWATEQPWIDVVSISWGAPANLPVGSSIPDATQNATDSGKVVVASSGNDPSPTPTGDVDGPPWVLSVTGSQADGRSHEVLSSNHYPDYTADYTVRAARADTTEDRYQRIGGTSFSCPTVAGTVAGIIHNVREDAGYTGGIANGELAPGVTNRDVRDALNRTAVLPAWDGYVAGLHYNGDHAHPPGAPWLTAQWGHVDARVIPDATQAILDGTLGVPQDKQLAAQYKMTTYQERAAYWT